MAIAKLAELSQADRQMVNGWLEEFDNNWHEKRLVARVRELPKQGPVRAAALIELVKIDMDHHWQQGRKARLEAYLKGFPELGTADTVGVELILAEFQARQGARQPVKIDDYASRFPKQAGELRDLLEKKEGAPVEAQRAALARARRVLLGPSIGVAAETPQPAAQKTGPNAPRKSPAGPVSLPEQFGRYRIIKELGKGGMGAVYLAHDLQLDRKVAVKIPHFTTNDSPTVRERFFREAKAAAHLDHPNVCPVYDVGEINGIHYLTMAYIEGKPLSSLIQKGKPLPQRGVAALVRKLALAMEQAHEAGVVHRDLKPANIMINKRKEPVIMDFGLARRVDKDARMTQSGQILGTPAYMPPEQVMGDIEAIGPASDVYSLGVILYELLTGRLPFTGGLGEVMAKIVTEAPDAPSDFRADFDPALEAICLKALAKESDQRYTSMASMAAALGKYLNLDVAEVKSPRTPAKAAPAGKKPSEAEKLVGQLVDQLVSRMEPAESRAAASRRFSRWTIFAAAVFLLGVAVIAYVIYRNSKTTPPDFNVVVQLKELKELNDPTIVVFILDGKEISKEELSKPISLSVGKHELLTKRGDGSVASRREINIKDASTIEVLPAVASSPDIKKAVPKVPNPKLGAGVLESGIGILEVASANSNLNVADPIIVAGVLEFGIGVFEVGNSNLKVEVPKPKEDWKPLFNGKDLAGWSIWPTGTAGWEVKEGVLTSDGPVTELFSPYGEHENFRIRFEAMINDGGVAGIYFRAKFGTAAFSGRQAYIGVINSTANHTWGKTGGLYVRGGSLRQLGKRVEKTRIPADTWFTGEIVANGNHLKFLVNGETVLDEVDSEKNYAEGFFALHRENRDTTIKLRKLELLELPPAPPIVKPGAEDGWVQLFNRKDVKGWKAFPNGNAGWQVKDGILIGSGPANALFTECANYENFHFRVEARINDHGDAGQFFRTAFRPDTPYGYTVRINSTADSDKMGTLYRVGGSSYHLGVPERQAYARIKPDTWFVQEVIADGNHLVVKVNGKTVVDVVHQQDYYTQGHLALHKYNTKTIVQFRTVEIKELPKSP